MSVWAVGVLAVWFGLCSCCSCILFSCHISSEFKHERTQKPFSESPTPHKSKILDADTKLNKSDSQREMEMRMEYDRVMDWLESRQKELTTSVNIEGTAVTLPSFHTQCVVQCMCCVCLRLSLGKLNCKGDLEKLKEMRLKLIESREIIMSTEYGRTWLPTLEEWMNNKETALSKAKTTRSLLQSVSQDLAELRSLFESSK